MATYCVHLGFDWKSYLIGTPWRSDGLPSSYWLQYALTSSSDYTVARLWKFIPSDTFNIVIWDLTAWASGETPYTGENTISIQGGVGANSLDGKAIYGPAPDGQPPGTPPNVLKASYQCGWANYGGDATKPYIQFPPPPPPPSSPPSSPPSPIVMSYPSGLESPWGPASGMSQGTSGVIANVIFVGGSPLNYKLNFELQVSYNGSSDNIFIADPETYIGSGKQ